MDTPPHLPPSPPVPPPLPPQHPQFQVPPPPSGGGAGIVRPLIVGAILLAGGAAWYFKNRSSQRARFEAESAETRATGLRAAFQGGGQPVSLTSPEAKAIDAVFVRMKQAYDKKDARALAECFDFAGVLEMAADQNPTSELKSNARRARRDSKGAKEGAVSAVQGLVRNADHLSYEIRRLELDAAGKQALAVVVWKNGDGSRSKERYWFLRDTEWKVCDYEELDTSIRMSTMIAAAAAHPGVMKSGGNAGEDFQKLTAAVVAGEPDKARPLLLKVRKSALGKFYADMTDMLEVTLFTQEEKPEEALAAADNLLKRRPDMPVLYYWRASILSDLERYAESIASAQKYLDILGDDPDMLNMMASSHLALKQSDKARDCALRVLAETPPNEEALTYFGRTARPEDAAKFEELLRKSEDAESSLISIASSLADEPPSAVHDVLVSVAEKVVPDAEVTASLKTERRARELWGKVTAAGAQGDALLVSALKEGTPEEAEALGESLRHSLNTAQDAAGLERLAAAGTEARPDTSEPLLAKAEATAIRLRPEIEKAADPDAALLEVLKTAKLPGAIAWNLAFEWQEDGKPELAKKAAAALKQVAPDDGMNEQMANYLGEGEAPVPAEEMPDEAQK